jgi:hypothetical protein
MEELEKAKLLSVATKLAQAQIQEVREELLEQLNSIQIPDAINGRDGREIVDARIFEGQLVLQLNDGAIITAGSVMGEQGPVGPIGARGEKGDRGDPGPRGDKGEHGVPGIEGPRGSKGDKGDKGDTGQQGERGEQGPEGIPGKRGQRGEHGEQGPSGVDGTAGSDGAKGETGERGTQGVSGRDGKNGKDGKQGPVGSVGPKGDKGDTGERGEKGDKGDPGSDVEVLKLEKKLEQFEQDVDKRISKVAFNAAMTGASPGSGEVLLHRLDDVDYNSVKLPTNGQALVWNVSIGKWAAGTVDAGGGASNQLVNGSYNVTLQANGVLTVPPNGLIIASTGQYGQQHEMRLGDGLMVGQDGTLANYKNVTWSLQGQNSDSGTQILLPGQTDSDNGMSLLIQHLYPNTSIDIESADYKWSFNANSELRLPSGVKLLSGYPGYGSYINNTATLAGDYVYLSSANGYSYVGFENQTITLAHGPNIWSFDIDGTIRFPDNTIQSTAYTGVVTPYLQVANANAKFATKAYAAANSYVKSTLANTNSYIATKASWSSLTATNTAVRALAITKLAVANAFSSLTKYAANTASVSTIASSVKLNDAITTNPAGLLAITLPDGSTVKIPYWN